jgi:hypothetical protein
VKSGSDLSGRVHLHGEPLPGIEDLDEDRKTGRWMVGVGLAEDFGPALGPKIMEGGSAKLAIVHDALGVLAIDNLPGFTHGDTWRKAFAKDAL